MRLLHPVRILGSPVMQVMVVNYYCGKYVCPKTECVWKNNNFPHHIYIKKLPTISQFASFITNMQLLSQGYFVGMEVNRF